MQIIFQNSDFAVFNKPAGLNFHSEDDEAKKEDRGYLPYALSFTLKGEAFSFICPPTDGERFLTQEAKEQLQNWAEPWELFK